MQESRAAKDWWLITDDRGAAIAIIQWCWTPVEARRVARAFFPELGGIVATPWSLASPRQRADAEAAYRITPARCVHAQIAPPAPPPRVPATAAAEQLRRRFCASGGAQ